MQRRGFLLGLGTALAAPAVVRASSLMKLWVPLAPELLYIDPNPVIGIVERFDALINEAIIQITGVQNLSVTAGNWVLRGRVSTGRYFYAGDTIRADDLV